MLLEAGPEDVENDQSDYQESGTSNDYVLTLDFVWNEWSKVILEEVSAQRSVITFQVI